MSFLGTVHAETCNCPSKIFSTWIKDFGCKDSFPQILKDLELFPTLNFSEFRSTTIERFDRPGSMSICNYIIKNNQVNIIKTEHKICYCY
jgi:hypothetical protein